MHRRARVSALILLTLAAWAGWGEWRFLGDGALVHAQAQFVLAWLLLVVWNLLSGSRRLALWAGMGLSAQLAVYSAPWRAPAPAAAVAASTTLRAVWFNAWGRPDAVDAVRVWAVDQQADLVALCQAGGGPALRRLAEEFPYQVYDHDDRIGLFSRLPLADSVWLHGRAGLEPPVRKWLRVGLAEGPELWIGHLQTPEHAAHAAGLDTLTRAWSSPGSVTVPAVLLADLNTTPWAADFRGLQRAGWRDARSGQRPRATWRDPARPWLRWPIDHVLVRGGVGVESFAVGEDLGSDHFPLLVELLLPTVR